MINMAVMPFHDKNLQKPSSLEPIFRWPWILVWIYKYYHDCIYCIVYILALELQILPGLFKWWLLLDLVLLKCDNKYGKMLKKKIHWRFWRFWPKLMFTVILWVHEDLSAQEVKVILWPLINVSHCLSVSNISKATEQIVNQISYRVSKGLREYIWPKTVIIWQFQLSLYYAKCEL